MDDDDEEELVTYEQLGERIRERYGGQTLAQQVEQYSQSYQTSQTILKQIQQDKHCQELLKSLPNLDSETLCQIIQNNIPLQEYEKLLATDANQQMDDGDAGLVISPTKNLQFLSNGAHRQIFRERAARIYQENGELFYDDEEDSRLQMDKKKRKNQKKKLKRKLKKAVIEPIN